MLYGKQRFDASVTSVYIEVVATLDARVPEHHRRPTGFTVMRLLAGLAIACVSLLAGIFVGGWIAFETPYWRSFRGAVEGLPVVSALHVGIALFVVAVGIGVVVAYRRPPKQRSVRRKTR